MKFITYILLIYYSLGALIPKSDFSQITQIDDLIRHYQLHQAEAKLMNQELSFWDFLYMHFITEAEHQHDNPSEHENLPLKKISTSNILFCLDALGLEKDLPQYFTQSFSIFKGYFLAKEFIFSIFQPPCYFIV